MKGLLPRAAGTAVVVLSLGSCAANSPTADESLTVYAAASLQAPFDAIAGQFEEDHPGVEVKLHFAGSSDLTTQIIAGAPAQVFAAANPETMERLAAEGLLVAEPVMFATNALTIAVPAGNPLGIGSLESLAVPDVAVVLCAPQVPCGAAAEEVQRITGVTLQPVSEETSVTDVLGKVSSGQADAGLVYVTDVTESAALDSVPFDAAGKARNAYPIAVTGRGGDLAEDFVAHVTGPRGRSILSSAGFGPPTP